MIDNPPQQRISGALLVLAFVTFVTGAILPLLGDKGEPNIFTLPVREQLQAVAINVDAWRWANVFMGAAVVVLVIGMTLLDRINEQVLSRIAMIGMVLAAMLWLIISVSRSTVTVAAAQETVLIGAVPPYYEPLAGWMSGLFRVYIVLGCLSLAAVTGSLILSRTVPAWVGWVAIAMTSATLVHLLITGDTLPAFHYFPALLLGIALVVRTES